MSNPFSKKKLKEAKAAIDSKDYAAARSASTEVLGYEPENYHAKVYLALALLELKEVGQSEEAYRSAIKLDPKKPLAWQGLSKVYERAQKWEQYIDILHNLAKLFSKLNDATNSAKTIEKIIDFRRENGPQDQLISALSLYLPDSPFYSVLSSLPPPDPTNPTSTTTHASQVAIQNSLPILEEIVSLIEADEGRRIEREVANRRQRLNAAGPEEVAREVKGEVFEHSRLPYFYDEILNHPNTSDELRRTTESKLLRHKQEYLYALPTTDDKAGVKSKLAAEVKDLVDGIVLLKIGDELAWNMYIDGKDTDTIEGYGYENMRQFVELFPSAGLSQLIRGYFFYMSIPLSENGDEENENGEPAPDPDPVEAFDNMLEAFSSLQSSIFAHRVIAEVHLLEMDNPSSIAVAEAGLGLVRRTSRNIGRDFPQVRKAFNVVLATSLVHHYPPKHHSRALRVIDEVLEFDPDNVPCLIGRGYICQHAKKWPEASLLFSRVVGLIPESLNDGLRTKEEHAWCLVHMDQVKEGADQLQQTLGILDNLDGRGEDKARCWWRLGRAHWEMGGPELETAYSHFIKALKCSSTFAPAFTSLGIYYAEVANPADPNRASKCFQKAFELDAREGDAARRLAEGFAEESEWDLVEVVARRTIEGEGGLEGGEVSNQGPAGRYLPTNAWAWKAVGAVELNRQKYSSAIQSFQVALRVDQDDELSWLRLGEAYIKAGRHVAATKALARAQELNPDDWICSYFLGEVERQTGQFQEAITTFEKILENRPSEPGVLMSLARTYLDLGLEERFTGLTARAESSFIKTLRVSLDFLDSTAGFRSVAWKALSDALYYLSQASSFADDDEIRDILSEVRGLIQLDAGERLAGIIPVPMEMPAIVTSLDLDVLKAAVVAFNQRISVGLPNSSATGSAWFDLGVALNSLARLLPGEQLVKAEKQAVSCIVEALRNDPNEEGYWVALGNIHFEQQPKLSQHAYIKALESNSKNPATWTSLGLLYLHHDDPELANEALYKAQTLDPDYTLAWVGQALVATRNGHDSTSTSLLEHAVSLTADIPEADLEFGKRVFARHSQTVRSQTLATSDLFPAFFVLDRYVKQRPNDASALHLFSLVCERVGHIERAIELLTSAIAILEAAYEDTEDPVVERQFVIANTSLGRLRLSAHDYSGAIEPYQTALGLLSSEEEEEDIDRTTRILLTQCRFGSALASVKLGEVEEALGLFDEALQSAGEDARMKGHISVLLAQTLWIMGTEESRESAKAQLLECIEADPENLNAINVLAALGISTDDDSLVDAALSEILALPLDRRQERDPQRNVNHLILQHHLGQGDIVQALSQAQKAVVAEPSRQDARYALASLTLQNGEPSAARASLAGFDDDIETSRKSLGLSVVAEALSDRDSSSAKHLAQKAVMLSPWVRRNWEALAYVQSR